MGKQTASKRQSLRHKHKVEKKVAEHHRKIRKFAKEHPELNKSKKDPGIPNLWPFKEDMLNKIEAQKQKTSDEKRNKKEQRRREQIAESKKDMASMAADAKRREEEFAQRQEERKLKGKGGDKFEKESKDSSLKAFYREVKKVIEAGDVILQVLDARDPMGCRCFEIEKMILERYTNKKIVLILNKVDLVPKENVLMWLKYLRNFYPTLAFKCSTQQQRRNLGQNPMTPETASSDMLNSTESLGAEQLLQLLKNYSRSLNIKTSVTVGIIGYPNVGKSSLINSLKRTRSVGVGATPGFTKIAQEVHLDKNVKLLDSPGIVPIKGNVDENIILRNVVKLEKVSDPIAPVEAILERCTQKQILDIYEIAEFSNTTQFLTQVAAKRKKIGRGGIADLRATAISVIRDWTGGKIPFYTQPPKVQVKSTLVSKFSDELNIDQSALLSTLSNQNTNFASLKYSEPKQQDLDTSLFDDEEEDDDEMDDEDEEEMEDEEEEEEDDEMEESSDDEALLKYQQQRQIVKPTAKQTAAINAKAQNLKDENDQFNPQSNKAMKKQSKKLKKKFGIISTAAANKSGDDSDDDDNNNDDEDDEDIDEGEVF